MSEYALTKRKAIAERAKIKEQEHAALRNDRRNNAIKLFQTASVSEIARVVGQSRQFVDQIKKGAAPLPLPCVELIHARYAMYGVTTEYLMTLTKAEKDNV